MAPGGAQRMHFRNLPRTLKPAEKMASNRNHFRDLPWTFQPAAKMAHKRNTYFPLDAWRLLSMHGDSKSYKVSLHAKIAAASFAPSLALPQIRMQLCL